MSRKRSTVTKEKILSAAGDVFVEKGFRDATIADICKRAGANISAVNYYFGSKEALYQEAWRHDFAESVRAYPQDGGISDNAPAEERLRGQLKALIERISDENNKEFFIAQMEIVNPTGLLEEVIRSALDPQRDKTLTIVRDLLGPKATEQNVSFCETCIFSMCIHPLLMQRVRRNTENVGTPIISDDQGTFAEHVVKFALAGINAFRG
ncbi:MAG: CerR family C-terminal domain-containing protein [Geobacteraceae bacterium]|nr:CerR family C-terminal domain-containing protein [Geobacteraceae bacterium]